MGWHWYIPSYLRAQFSRKDYHGLGYEVKLGIIFEVRSMIAVIRPPSDNFQVLRKWSPCSSTLGVSRDRKILQSLHIEQPGRHKIERRSQKPLETLSDFSGTSGGPAGHVTRNSLSPWSHAEFSRGHPAYHNLGCPVAEEEETYPNHRKENTDGTKNCPDRCDT